MSEWFLFCDLVVIVQAVHNPFSDTAATFPSGIPDSYVNASVLEYVAKHVKGTTFKQYFMAMSIMVTPLVLSLSISFM